MFDGTGCLPAELGKLLTLEELDLSYNALTGESRLTLGGVFLGCIVSFLAMNVVQSTLSEEKIGYKKHH